MSWDVDEKEFYETFAEIESDRGIEEAKQWAWSALDWTQKELRKKEDGAKKEHAAVVAWLRAEATLYTGEGLEPMQAMFSCGAGMTLVNAADSIERGEHRKEEP